ncbi:hypothetical protein PR048_000218 [Dryococelus australis]|uniref:Uncharacterized protein n=1 Tax=Dryococelus australis TaxID=614101 RepID=A0ABQ9IE21_9NEOP|nr:hypothetical protein PR048_000218 [Dryococelus australis]
MTRMLDSADMCTLEPQMFVHWLLPHRVASVTSHLAVWHWLVVSLLVCYGLRVVQDVSSDMFWASGSQMKTCEGTWTECVRAALFLGEPSCSPSSERVQCSSVCVAEVRWATRYSRESKVQRGGRGRLGSRQHRAPGLRRSRACSEKMQPARSPLTGCSRRFFLIVWGRAAVTQWLACSPPTQGEPGSIPGPGHTLGNRVGRCRW